MAVTMILPVGFVVYCWSTLWHSQVQGNPEPDKHVNIKRIGPEEISRIELALDLPKNSLSVKVLEDFRHRILNPYKNLQYFLWYASIFGIGISVIPAIIVFYPVVQPYIEPLVARLNRIKIIYELLAYFMCTRVIVAAHKSQHKHRDIIALTGLVLSIPALAVTSWVHDTSFTGLNSGLFVFMSSLPMTYVFKSRIIGFVNIACAFHVLGFLVIPIESGYLVGFDDVQRVDTALLASFTMIILYFLELVLKIGIFEHFHSGMSVLGPCVFGIAGLIKCSQPSDRLYILTNVAYVSLLSVFLVLSTIHGKKAVFNASTTFTVLWILEKLITYVGGYTWFIVLGASVGLWRYLAVK